MPDFCLPDLGEGLTEAEIVAWHVAVGDEVAIDQTVVEVETAKASVEVPIPYAGTVSELHGTAGQTVAVGAPLVSVAAAVTEQTAVAAGSGSVLIGYGTPPPGQRRARRAPAAAAVGSRTVAVVSPLVRRMARERGLDLADVPGSGPSGLIMRSDVEQAGDAAPEPSDVQRVPLRTRRAVVEKLTRSRREIPEATVWVDVDATDLLAARAAMNARGVEPAVTVLALLARFAIAGLRRYPELNGRIENDELVLPRAVTLGFAAQTERGLVVPVLRDAQRLSLRELSGELAALTRRAREGAVAPADLSGGTFTVNNYGVFGVDGSAAIINHPEVAILGIGRIMARPWVVDDALSVRSVAQLTLAFDHRACDGGTAGGFLRYVADCVESPLAFLADV